MSGVLTLKCSIIRGGMATYLTPMGPTPLHVHPIFEIGPLEPRYSEWLVFEGLSVDETGKQHFMDATVACARAPLHRVTRVTHTHSRRCLIFADKRAVLNCIDYLHKFGWSREQIYLLLSACPCEGRLSGIVDVPSAYFRPSLRTLPLTGHIPRRRVRHDCHPHRHLRCRHPPEAGRPAWCAQRGPQDCPRAARPGVHLRIQGHAKDLCQPVRCVHVVRELRRAHDRFEKTNERCFGKHIVSKCAMCPIQSEAAATTGGSGGACAAEPLPLVSAGVALLGAVCASRKSEISASTWSTDS